MHFTQKLHEAILTSQVEALKSRHTVIDIKHVLLGLLTTQDSLAVEILTKCEVNSVKLYENIQALVRRISPRIDCAELCQYKMTQDAQSVIDRSERIAEQFQCSAVSTQHLLLSLLLESESEYIKIIYASGVSYDIVYDIVRNDPCR